jgi:hypothetical protein
MQLPVAKIPEEIPAGEVAATEIPAPAGEEAAGETPAEALNETAAETAVEVEAGPEPEEEGPAEP